MHSTTHTRRAWRKRAAERLMPWFEGAVVVSTALMTVFWILAVIAAVGFYLLAAIVVISVCLLIMRLGGWKIDWAAWLEGRRK